MFMPIELVVAILGAIAIIIAAVITAQSESSDNNMPTEIVTINQKGFAPQGIKIQSVSPLKDIISSEEEVRVEFVTYTKSTFLYGAYTFEKGRKIIVQIRGKPGFCAAVINELKANGHTLNTLASAAPPKQLN
jgi:hypothetical protein